MWSVQSCWYVDTIVFSGNLTLCCEFCETKRNFDIINSLKNKTTRWILTWRRERMFFVCSRQINKKYIWYCNRKARILWFSQTVVFAELTHVYKTTIIVYPGIIIARKFSSISDENFFFLPFSLIPGTHIIVMHGGFLHFLKQNNLLVSLSPWLSQRSI